MTTNRLTSFNEESVQTLETVKNRKLNHLQKIIAREELQEEKNETKADGTQLLNLPFDVIRYIHDHLILFDYMSFRLVSKLCREVAPAIDMRTAISRSITESNSLSPWLMYVHDEEIRIRFSHQKSLDRYSIEIPEALKYASNWYCKDDWLLIGIKRDKKFYVSFFNPFTNGVISYKEFLMLGSCFTRIAFSSPPTSHNCVVVVIMKSNSTQIRICISKAKGWHFFEFPLGRGYWPTSNFPVFANGDLYFTNLYGIGILKLQGEGCDLKIIDKPPKSDYFENGIFLAERNEEVFIVLKRGQQRPTYLHVYKLDPSTLTWKMVDNLGDYNLHVTMSSALFTAVKNSEDGNRIYVNMPNDEHFVYYFLSTNCVESSQHKDAHPMRLHHEFVWPYKCVWIRPT